MHISNLISRFFPTTLLALATSAAPAQPLPFEVSEKTILELQAAQSEGRATARSLVEAYLARIAAYDQVGPSLNTILRLNPRALQEAEALDLERKAKGPRGPLHGIPVLLKDNFETNDMPTSGGTLALATLETKRDAFQVAQLRKAGAVILGKTALHELAAGITTISSLTGATRNPYDPARVPGGSSGGTAAAVAASFAAAGMGTDTCGSIRIPAGNQNLVGMRVTRGLSSRYGIVPLSGTQDVAGPLARSIGDLAILLDATVGPDSNDPVTLSVPGGARVGYYASLKPDGLKGKRIGVLTALFGSAPEDSEVATIVRKSLDLMKKEGVELVDVAIPEVEALMQDGNVIGFEFKFDLQTYLAQHPSAPVKSLQDIISQGLNHEQLDAVFRLRNAPAQRETEAYRQALEKQVLLRERVSELMRSRGLDAIVYPVLRRKAVRIGEAQTGFTCQLSGNSGLPALSVPAGFTDDGVPVGMELLGPAFSEPQLMNLGYAWEVTGQLRRPPYSTPPLVNGRAPAAVNFEARLADPKGASARVKFRYDRVTSKLFYTTNISGVSASDVVALTLQKGTADQAGPVLAHLVRAGQSTSDAELVLRSQEREALAAGRLFVHLYTRQAPLGAGRSPVVLPN